MTPFRWENCFADVQTSKHDITIQSYLDDVILPALETLSQKIDALRQSDWPGHEFAQADMEEVLHEAKLAFGLSIQSIWERQLRSYLLGCAKALRPNEHLANKIEKADWKNLCKFFRDLRGISLEDFPSFDTLDNLQHLGNACRHGDGNSSNELSQRCPDLWHPIPLMPPKFNPQPSFPPSVKTMDISIENLRLFVSAIATFWNDVKYIYNESIERKHQSLESWLVRERAERRWIPQIPEIAANEESGRDEI